MTRHSILGVQYTNCWVCCFYYRVRNSLIKAKNKLFSGFGLISEKRKNKIMHCVFVLQLIRKLQKLTLWLSNRRNFVHVKMFEKGTPSSRLPPLLCTWKYNNASRHFRSQVCIVDLQYIRGVIMCVQSNLGRMTEKQEQMRKNRYTKKMSCQLCERLSQFCLFWDEGSSGTANHLW